eukprot:484277_1
MAVVCTLMIMHDFECRRRQTCYKHSKSLQSPYQKCIYIWGKEPDPIGSNEPSVFRTKIYKWNPSDPSKRHTLTLRHLWRRVTTDIQYCVAYERFMFVLVVIASIVFVTLCVCGVGVVYLIRSNNKMMKDVDHVVSMGANHAIDNVNAIEDVQYDLGNDSKATMPNQTNVDDESQAGDEDIIAGVNTLGVSRPPLNKVAM